MSTQTGGPTGAVKQLGLRLDRDLWQRLRFRSVEEDRKASEIVRDAIEQYLERAKAAEAKASA